MSTGGFGLNTGVQDVHNLIHKLVPILKNPDYKDPASTFNEYSQERRKIASKNLSIAMKYYQKSLEIPRLLGLDIQNLRTFKLALEKIPLVSDNLKSFFFKAGVKLGSFPVEIKGFQKEREVLSDEKNKIPLIFIEEDIGFSYQEERGMKGKLLPIFNIKVNGNEMFSRELIAKIWDLYSENALDHHLNRGKGSSRGYYVIFVRKIRNLQMIKDYIKDNIKNYDSFEYFVLFNEEENEDFFDENKIGLIGYSTQDHNILDKCYQNNTEDFCLIRSDGHII